MSEKLVKLAVRVPEGMLAFLDGNVDAKRKAGQHWDRSDEVRSCIHLKWVMTREDRERIADIFAGAGS